MVCPDQVGLDFLSGWNQGLFYAYCGYLGVNELGDAVAKRASPGMPKPNVCPRRSGNSEKPAYAKPIVAGISPGGF